MSLFLSACRRMGEWRQSSTHLTSWYVEVGVYFRAQAGLHPRKDIKLGAVQRLSGCRGEQRKKIPGLAVIEPRTSSSQASHCTDLRYSDNLEEDYNSVKRH